MHMHQDLTVSQINRSNSELTIHDIDPPRRHDPDGSAQYLTFSQAGVTAL